MEATLKKLLRWSWWGIFFNTLFIDPRKTGKTNDLQEGRVSSLREQWARKQLQESRTRTQLGNVPQTQSKCPSQLLSSKVSEFTRPRDSSVFPIPPFPNWRFIPVVFLFYNYTLHFWGAANFLVYWSSE